jgi:hypothetical protein
MCVCVADDGCGVGEIAVQSLVLRGGWYLVVVVVVVDVLVGLLFTGEFGGWRGIPRSSRRLDLRTSAPRGGSSRALAAFERG